MNSTIVNNLYGQVPGTEKWRFSTGDVVMSSPAIVSDGTIYIGSNDHNFYAIYSDSYGLANISWPKFRHDEGNSGCLCNILVPFNLGIKLLLLIFITNLILIKNHRLEAIAKRRKSHHNLKI